MDGFKIIAGTGILGYGLSEASLARGMEMRPHAIGCDAGSTDAGPYYLGSGKAFVSRTACKRDTEMLLKAALNAGIPLLIGSAGGGGGDQNLDWLVEIVREIAAENSLHFKLGIIHSEVDKQYLTEKLSQGKVTSLGVLPELTVEDIDRAEHIVGLMGPEPFNRALDLGADVVVAGRSSDTAVFSSVAMRHGCKPGLAWHAAKILECGAISADRVTQDCIIVTIRDDHFIVEPLSLDLRHTVLSTAAHALYENASPYHLYEPGVMLDLTNVRYEQATPRSVKVSGAEWRPAPAYRVKLEAAEKVGYRTLAIMGTRDPILIGQIDRFVELVKQSVRERVRATFRGKVSEDDYSLVFRIYGKDAVMGAWEVVREPRSHELGIVIEAIAKDPETSAAILAYARTYALHQDFPGRMCIAGNMAIAFSPSDIPVGPVYRFSMDHLVEVDDPCEMFRIEVVSV